MPEWKRYRCSVTPDPERASDSAAGLSTVHHIAHLPTARRILEDRRLRAGLVYDESKLNRSRIRVTWLSANNWHPGSFYGNVQFTFDWADVVDGQDFYWVEAMTQYSPTAYRLLLTNRDMNRSPDVEPYDPNSDKGPVRRRKERWFWNDRFTSEFMLEADIPLRKCTGLGFVSHHPAICRTHPRVCNYRDDSPETTAGLLLAFILGFDIRSANHALIEENGDRSKRLTRETDQGIRGLWRALAAKHKKFSGPMSTKESAEAILVGALALYGMERLDEAKELISLLKSRDVFETTLVELVKAHFRLRDYELPG